MTTQRLSDLAMCAAGISFLTWAYGPLAGLFLTGWTIAVHSTAYRLGRWHQACADTTPDHERL